MQFAQFEADGHRLLERTPHCRKRRDLVSSRSGTSLQLQTGTEQGHDLLCLNIHISYEL